MKDVLDELAAAHRAMGEGSLPAGDAYTVEVRRRYDAPVDDVWDALTSPERLRRWLKAVTGDLRPGGTFELDGGEHGEILRCEPPRLLRVSWLFGPDADVGWDLALLALARLLTGGGTADQGRFRTSPEGREFVRRSAAAWGRAHLDAGGEPEHVAAAVAATTAFYAPDPRTEGTP